jgi:hypothetical protein
VFLHEEYGGSYRSIRNNLSDILHITGGFKR